MKRIKKRYIFLTLGVIAAFIILLNHFELSYCRRIGDTRFYLVETLAISEKGKRLAGLYYMPTDGSGYYGGRTPGYPLTVLWNDHYIISKNFDGNNPVITEYVIINMDSIIDETIELRDIRRFEDEKEYYNYLKEIGLSEDEMKQTDNHLGLW